MTKKTIWFWGIGIATGLYATFVLQQLWNWFLAPSLNASPISFWAMYGLHLFIVLLTDHLNRGWEEDSKWEILTNMLTASVSDERREKLVAILKKQADEIWSEVGGATLGQAVKYSVTLALGWVVHTVFI